METQRHKQSPRSALHHESGGGNKLWPIFSGGSSPSFPRVLFFCMSVSSLLCRRHPQLPRASILPSINFMILAWGSLMFPEYLSVTVSIPV